MLKKSSWGCLIHNLKKLRETVAYLIRQEEQKAIFFQHTGCFARLRIVSDVAEVLNKDDVEEVCIGMEGGVQALRSVLPPDLATLLAALTVAITVLAFAPGVRYQRPSVHSGCVYQFSRYLVSVAT